LALRLELMIKRTVFGLLAILFIFAAGVFAGPFLRGDNSPVNLKNPLAELIQPEETLPYLPYTIQNLRSYDFTARDITIEDVIQDYPTYTAYQFSYSPLGRKMSGQLNIPKELPVNPQAIVMVRGWAPLASYYTGMGTKNAAAAFAENGYITLAPDFFGYGDSEPEPADSWLARFEKPMVVIELIRSLEELGVPLTPEATTKYTPSHIGIWAHSNGGQIALTALEITNQSYPATLWAPVVAPFPYSVLFFSDEDADEGKDFRKYVANLEAKYDVFDFSLTQHLPLLTGPLQLHHGTADTAALSVWSDEFFAKVDKENSRRARLQERLNELREELENEVVATNEAKVAEIQNEIAASETSNLLEPIVYQYFKYPGADHNLVPNWSTAVQRDLVFFEQEL